jgi:hypothetical protein
MPFPTSIALYERVRYAGSAHPVTAVADWLWHSLIALRADVSREPSEALRFQVPAIVSLSPLSPLAGIHDGHIDISAADGVVNVDVLLTTTRAFAITGAAAGFAGLLAAVTSVAGSVSVAGVLVALPYLVARRNFRAYLRGCRLALETRPDARPPN